MPEVRPYGSWSSPITSELITRAAVGISEVMVDPVTGDVWWAEQRPEEGARTALVRASSGAGGNLGLSEAGPADFNTRTRVHEYGGGAWSVHAGAAYASSWVDQRLHRLSVGGDARAVTPPPPPHPASVRFADGRLTPDGTVWIGVRETHPGPTHPGPTGEVCNEIVAIPLPVDADAAGTTHSEPPVPLVTGPDFVSFPRVSPDGTRLAWTQWDHPNMPWDGTTLCVADLIEGALGPVTALAGGSAESVFQPEWSRDSSCLYFVSDRTDWWTLYVCDGRDPRTVRCLVDREWEIATPQWVFNMSRYAVVGDDRIVAAAGQDGLDRLYLITGVGTGPGEGDVTVQEIPTDFTSFASVRVAADRAVMVAASPTAEPGVVSVGLDPSTAPDVTYLRPPRDLGLPDGLISRPVPLSFPSGPSGARTAHALHYPPANPDQVAPEGETPPLVVMIHGGPTSAARPMLQLGHQYWTSRGFAVVDVNYGGSTGYGRPYRRLLDGQWGIVDVEDCIAAARGLASAGQADPGRLLIRGGSAGGYTTLAALIAGDTFAAGASHYGVADLEALATDTHKFESRYLDTLIGPYPESADLYRERSPIHHTDRLDRPLAIFQGAEDEIVPPNQAEMLARALDRKGIPHAYVVFEGEQHGFRQATNIRRALDGELYFYSRVLGFELGDPVDPVEIHHPASLPGPPA